MMIVICEVQHWHRTEKDSVVTFDWQVQQRLRGLRLQGVAALDAHSCSDFCDLATLNAGAVRLDLI